MTPAHLGREVAESIPGVWHAGLPGSSRLGLLEDHAAINEAMLALFPKASPPTSGPVVQPGSTDRD